MHVGDWVESIFDVVFISSGDCSVVVHLFFKISVDASGVEERDICVGCFWCLFFLKILYCFRRLFYCLPFRYWADGGEKVKQ